mmetsp:Transcript_61008/g.145376  ORF Transcript_61008/g.145376 Transcript_61008/m.145376 type:complete len:243 (+) Transcript_61008:73-801(+)
MPSCRSCRGLGRISLSMIYVSAVLAVIVSPTQGNSSQENTKPDSDSCGSEPLSTSWSSPPEYGGHQLHSPSIHAQGASLVQMKTIQAKRTAVHEDHVEQTSPAVAARENTTALRLATLGENLTAVVRNVRTHIADLGNQLASSTHETWLMMGEKAHALAHVNASTISHIVERLKTGQPSGQANGTVLVSAMLWVAMFFLLATLICLTPFAMGHRSLVREEPLYQPPAHGGFWRHAGRTLSQI